MEGYLLSASGKVHSPKCTTFANIPTAELVETVPDDAVLADCRACPDAFSDESVPVTEQYPFRIECLRCGSSPVEDTYKGAPALWCPTCERMLFRSA